ncbi:MAG: hypothetical protein H0W11_11245 [Gemmatimonadetes bacterium]|nr:hypothetical protein [Gemmatimonadota bacterium]
MLGEAKALWEAFPKHGADCWLPVPEWGIELAPGCWVEGWEYGREDGGIGVPRLRYVATVQDALERRWARKGIDQARSCLQSDEETEACGGYLVAK